MLKGKGLNEFQTFFSSQDFERSIYFQYLFTEFEMYIKGKKRCQACFRVFMQQSGTSNYIWTETYFDGLGRTIKTRAEGSAGKVIATQTIYNNRGLVDKASLPYFEGSESPRWITYVYDPIGRVIKTTYPDSTFTTASYLKGTFTYKYQ